MKLKIETFTGETVLEVKTKLSAVSEYPVAKQGLLYMGKNLEDDKTLEECGVKDNGTTMTVLLK